MAQVAACLASVRPAVQPPAQKKKSLMKEGGGVSICLSPFHVAIKEYHRQGNL
jgi:hypothetical protein